MAGAIGGVDRAVGALDPQADGLLQRRDHRVQGGIRILNFALDAADAALELVGLRSSGPHSGSAQRLPPRDCRKER